METIVNKKLTLEEFLALPDNDVTYELVDGVAIPKMSPKRFHSRVTVALSLLLTECTQGKGEMGIEWAITLKRQGKDWCPVPDLLYISNQRLGDIPLADEPCRVPPELVIEIISPGQAFSDLSEKAVAYLNAGVKRVWLIDSQVKKVTIFYPDRPPQIKQGDDSLADEILPDLNITPQQIFSQAGL